MAKPTIRLIKAIRSAAGKIQAGSPYMWGHMGACNCGHLAQELTHLSKKEIHARALERMGDWNDQCDDFCPTSGLAIDDLIQTMLDAGLDLIDLKNLEKLSDRKVLNNISQGHLPLVQNNKSDVVKYLQSWANVLEQQLIDKISISDINKSALQKAVN